VIEFRNMSFGYKGKKLFKGLDLTLVPGTIYGLLGKNGAGKTTLLKLICGLRFPQSGTCSVMGFDPARRPAGLLEEICFISEELFVPPIRPGLFERLYAPLYPRFDHAALDAYLGEFEVDKSRKLTEMSYGQKKKFLVAFGLASRCGVVLLDEPTNGLDIPSKSQFRRILAGAAAEDQLILVSTHQVRDMENLIDPLVILDEGRVIFQQSMQEAAQRMAVSVEREEQKGADVLYSEKTLGGYVVVRENTTGEETNIDLEVLFNAVIAGRDRVQALFARQMAEV
jgi:ABC-2 type transport system ATP-binding protein